jgi:LPXTG-site transpeptidase (sortase) family protein
MSSSRAKAVLIASSILLVACGLVWSFGQTRSPRSDLSGTDIRLDTAARRSASTSVPTTSSFPTSSVGAQLPVLPAPPIVEAPAVVETPMLDVRPVTFPTRIEIPSLAVDAAVVAVGLESDGSMEIPPPTVAGWYHYGPLPGASVGSAVIAGHVDSRGLPGVFLELRRVEIGAYIAISNADGRVHRYVVNERFQVDKQDLPSAELFRTTGEPVLTLITCGGEFDRSARRYDDNIIIRATLVSDSSDNSEPVVVQESPGRLIGRA